ncbi:MAG: peptidoglycan editing factor PgeF [Phocaeicola sp.]
MNNLFSKDKRMLVYGLNESYADIFCFSTTRHGGYSTGQYSSFNCNHYCGDSPENVERNRTLLVEILPGRPKMLIVPHQVHSTVVRTIDIRFLSASEAERKNMLEGVDAVITNLPEVCVCVSTADCIPILCYDVRNKAVAAVHAGWRGTVARIVEKTLTKMQAEYGTRMQDIVAAIGPGISLQSFEVGDEVYQAFSDAGFDMDAISRRYGKWHIDLWEANRRQLISMGVNPDCIEMSGICTYIENEDFFSARRMGINSGRIISGIMLR